MGFHFGRKSKKWGHSFLKGVAQAGTIARKGGRFMEGAGKAMALVGAATGNPELAAMGAEVTLGGAAVQSAGIIERKAARGAAEGNMKKLRHSGDELSKVVTQVV